MKPACRKADYPDRDALAERQVEYAGEIVALVAVVDRVAFQAHVGIEARHVWLVRDIAQRPGLRARAVERALRARQRLDALDVDQANLGLQRALSQRLLVEVDRGGGVSDEGRGVVGDAAEVDRTAARRDGVVGKARHEARDVLDRTEIGARELLLADRLDLLGNVEQRFFALAGRHDHGLEVRGLRLRQYGRRVVARQRDRDGIGDPGDRGLVVRL
jgi:hypothetical protein